MIRRGILSSRNVSKIHTLMEQSDDDRHPRQLKSNDAGRPPLSIIESVADDSTSSPFINSAQQKDNSRNSSLLLTDNDHEDSQQEQFIVPDYNTSKFKK